MPLAGPEAAARSLLQAIVDGSPDEAKRRNLFDTHLAAMFPEQHWKLVEYSLGTEMHVRIPGLNGASGGRIDTKHGAIIIEHKRELKSAKDIEKAEDQARDYVAGLALKENRIGIRRIVLTDILRWREYDVHVAGAPAQANRSKVTLTLRSQREFKAPQAADFLAYVGQILWSEPVLATPHGFVNLLGPSSGLGIALQKGLGKAWKARPTKERDLILTMWNDYVSSCYAPGAAPDQTLFLLHSYLVAISRITAGSVLAEAAARTKPGFAASCVEGTAFKGYFVDNFVPDDFFRWTREKETLDELKQEMEVLQTRLSSLDFTGVDRFDFMSHIYQEMMPRATQQEFGEVFTPAWLSSEIVAGIPSIQQLAARVIDPACGPGSFLVATIQAKKGASKTLPPGERAQAILDTIVGIDINPVSVALCKAALAISLADEIRESNRPVRMGVYQADSLAAAEHLIVDQSNTTIEFDLQEPAKVVVSTKIVEREDAFDLFVDTCQEAASLDSGKSKALIQKRCEELASAVGLEQSQVASFTKAATELSVAMRNRIADDRDTIWTFVLKNSYRPHMMRRKFDVLVMNPPWLTISNLPNARYKGRLQQLAAYYEVAPTGPAAHHLEVSTVFTLHAVQQFVKKGGEFGVILPATVLNGHQHDPFRTAEFKETSALNGELVWDLRRLKSLFKRLAIVLFGDRGMTGKMPPELQAVIFREVP